MNTYAITDLGTGQAYLIFAYDSAHALRLLRERITLTFYSIEQHAPQANRYNQRKELI